MAFEDEEAVKAHIEMHANYPATKARILATCSNMSCMRSEKDKRAIMAIPERQYNSYKDVEKALKMM